MSWSGDPDHLIRLPMGEDCCWWLFSETHEFLLNGVFMDMTFDNIVTSGYLEYFVGMHKMLRIARETVIHQM